MYSYTLDTTKIDVKRGLLTKEESKIISAFIKARDKYYECDSNLEALFRGKIADALAQAKTPQDFIDIKRTLTVMPESVGKTLIFRTLIIKEDQDGLK